MDISKLINKMSNLLLRAVSIDSCLLKIEIKTPLVNGIPTIKRKTIINEIYMRAAAA